MARKTARASIDRSRLTVLAASGDDSAFLEYALELLDSGDRLAREAALDALLERPVAAARPALRAMYQHLHADPLKRDQGGLLRGRIVRILHALGDPRDSDIGVLAIDSSEIMVGQDVTPRLRAYGLMMLADLDRDLLPYYATEHLDDFANDEEEPAMTAFRLLAALEEFAPVYGWLLTSGQSSRFLPLVFETFLDAPPTVVRRYVTGAVELAIRMKAEPMCTSLADAIVRLEIEHAYPLLETLMTARLSDDLYDYLALLLASTNRAPLLEVLERELNRSARWQIVEQALRVRTTPEQEAILERWERR